VTQINDESSLLVDLTKPAAGEIHLWRLSFQPEHHAEYDPDAINFLSSDEQLRLAGMTYPGPAARFLRGRTLMRRVLGGYLSKNPAEVSIIVDAAGKPSVGSVSEPPLTISLSHAGQETILAVTLESDIGVDLEPLSKAPAAMRIAEEFFAPSEHRSIHGSDGDSAETALMLWTLKESIVKARGESMWSALEGIALGIDGRNILWRPPPPNWDRWYLAAGRLGEAHCLAVSCQHPNKAIPTDFTFKFYDTTGAHFIGGVFEPALTN